MTYLIVHPPLVFAITFACLWLAAVAGNWLHKGRSFSESRRHEYGRDAHPAGLLVVGRCPAPANRRPTPLMALAVSAMNDVLNALGYVRAAAGTAFPLRPGYSWR